MRSFASHTALRSLLTGALLLATAPAFAQGAPAKPGDKPPEGVPAKAPAAPAEPPPPPAPSPAPAPPPAPTPLPPPAIAPSEPAKAAPDAGKPDKKDKEAKTGDRQKGLLPGKVYAEDWWSHTRPVFEFHGYYRVRAELFHNFALGRADVPSESFAFPRPVGDSYTAFSGAGNREEFNVLLCGENPGGPYAQCRNKSLAGANMRFRLNPELHLSDNVRILSQIDMLDNLVMGSTPDSYYTQLANGSQVRGAQSGYTPMDALTTTTYVPSSGQNAQRDSVRVKRVWGEYTTPVGLLRFGRMPHHWGLGIFANAGDDFDGDWQSTIDRVMFISGIKSLDLYIGGAWDFMNEGAIATYPNQQQGQPYDQGQLDDVDQYALMIMRRKSPDQAKRLLAQGKPVFNGGLYTIYRRQTLANDTSGTAGTDNIPGQTPENIRQGLTRRGAEMIIPDLWAQILYKKFRFEVEALTVQGSVENTETTASSNNYTNPNPDLGPNGWTFNQWMVATQMELKAVEDKLRVQFGFGWASGDADTLGLNPTSAGLQNQQTFDRTFSMARFHPNYRVDLILFRNILSRVQGAYYFRPSVEYDFARNMNGQKFGGGAAVIWSRASEFVQAPGHKRDLGLELDLTLYYQAKDGSLNDNPDKKGGFYTMLQYGVLFPLGGLGYQTEEVNQAASNNVNLDTETAQTMRWYMGILF